MFEKVEIKVSKKNILILQPFDVLEKILYCSKLNGLKLQSLTEIYRKDKNLKSFTVEQLHLLRKL